MKKSYLFLFIPLIFSMVACSSTRHSAPVVEHSLRTGKSNDSLKPSATSPKLLVRTADSHGFYTVKKGDTLIHIALDFGQNYRDIIAWNNLSNPNDIKIDQLLRVIPPDGSGAAQTSSVAVAPNIEIKPLGGATDAPRKTSPRVDKRVYSEAAWAELQKPETNGTAAVVPSNKIEAARPAEAKAVEKSASTALLEEANIAWIWPTEGKIMNTYDESKKGIDIGGVVGQPILAAETGKVMYAGSGIRGYGNLVIVKHTNSLLSAYAHNKTILVKEGQNVNKGQKIAEMGNSDADVVKLHFEIRQQGKPVDPSKLLPGR